MLALVLALAAQASDPPPADVVAAPVEAPRPPPVQMVADDVDGDHERTHALLEAFAQEGRAGRLTGAVTSGVLGAGLIGAGITYVAVSHVDHQLSQKDHEDTQLAGFVIGGTALIPAAVMIAQLVMPSAEEERLEAFESASDKRASVAAARASIAEQANSGWLAPTLGGAAFIVGGLASAAAGGVFLALPHIPDVERGPMTHATGAELIGAGVSSVGVGTVLLIAGGSSASLQMKLLDAGAE